MIGNSEKLNSTIAGSSAASGNSGLAMSTFSRTSCRASVMSIPASNSAVMLETLSTDCEVSVLMSEILFSSSSRGRVISVSMSSGATPE